MTDESQIDSQIEQQLRHADAISVAHEKGLILRRRWILGFLLSLVSLLWLGAHLDGIGDASLWPFRAPSQLVMLWASCLAVLAMLAVVRSQAIESVFGGLGEAVRWHRGLGLASLVLLTVHVLLLAGDALLTGVPVSFVLLPFTMPGQRSLDILFFYVLIVLGILAYDRRMRHEKWLFVHRLLGLTYTAGIVHASIEPGSIQNFEPLRTFFVILILVGLGAWTYNVLILRRMGPRYLYQVEAVHPRGNDTVDLVLKPVEQRMMFVPGAFVLLRVPGFKGMTNELHPFSIASSPVERDLQLSIVQRGDFTKFLSYLSLGPDHPEYWKHRKPGKHHPVSTLRPQEVLLYGPFGGFSMMRFMGYRRLVWIATGIGVTPFLSMLKFEQHNRGDFRRIWFYYLVRNEDEAIYQRELEELCASADSYVDLTVWVSTQQGRLSAAQIAEDVGFDDYAVMMCGTRAAVDDLSRQFKKLGLPQSRIISEELQFRASPKG